MSHRPAAFAEFLTRITALGAMAIACCPAALGAQHFWTTAEDRGAIQPASDSASGVDLLVGEDGAARTRRAHASVTPFL